MNWDTQLNSIMNATESDMTKIKERLYIRGELTKGELKFNLPHSKMPQYDEAPTNPAVPYSCPANSICAGSSEDMVNISSQLLSQAKMITSLHQAISRLEQDRDYQQQRIQSLEDEVRRLRGLQGDVSDSALERKMEGLKHELFNELRSLQERLRDPPVRETSSGQRSAASIVQEVNENKRLIWIEYESLRRDTDYLHQRLRRQEEDLLRQLSEMQEVKRSQDRNAKMLEGLLSSQQTQTMELNRRRSETQEVQRDLLQIRSAIGNIREDMKVLEEKVSAHSARSDRTERGKPTMRKKKNLKSPTPSSEEDSASQISLADISSEDTSYSFSAAAPSHGSRARSSTSHKQNCREPKTRNSLQLGDFNDDLDRLSDSPPELSFSDL